MNKIALIFSAILISLISGCGDSSDSTSSTSSPPNNTATINYDVNVINTGVSNVYQLNGTNQPTLNLERGKTYTFSLSGTVSGHPFRIQTVAGGGGGSANDYTSDVTNNGATSGVVTFVVPSNAPSTLYYACGSHSGMGGTISITN